MSVAAPVLRTPSIWLALLTQGLLPAQDAPAKPALDGMIEQRDGRFRFPRVAAWKYAKFETSPLTTELNAAFAAWSFRARTIEYVNIEVTFLLLNGARPSPRLQAIYDRYGKMGPEQTAPEDYRIGLEPVVHATYPVHDGRSDLIVYRPAYGRMLSLRFTVDAPKFQSALPVLLELAQHVEVDLPTWPATPTGYDYEPESGLQIGFDKSVSKKRRKQMRKFVRDVVKDFSKEHGAPYLEPTAPVVLFVSDDMDRNAKLVGSDEGYSADFALGPRRVVTIAVDPKERSSAAACRSMLYRYLSWTVYPEQRCMWLHWGIRDLADDEGRCGKRLPTVPDAELPKLAGVTKRLDQVTADGARVDLVEAASWVAFFRLAPTKQRRAFGKLLEELRTGVAPEDAVRVFVDAYEPLKLQSDARTLLRKKLKAAK